jgi:hypothetical protein
MYKAAMRTKILFSYWDLKRRLLRDLFAEYPKPYPQLFMDSGAFTASTKGVKIDIKEYAQWIRENREYIHTYANLDVIGNAEATWKNQQRLEDMGLNPLPVFHTREPWEYLERYIEKYDYVGLGGLVPFAKGRDPVYMAWVLKCFQMAKGKCVYHGFGVTNWTVLKNFPWYSVDSTSWLAGTQYGQVPIWDRKENRIKKIGLYGKEWFELSDMVRKYGLDPNVFADRSKYIRNEAIKISSVAYQKAEDYLQVRHGAIPLSKENEGLHLYLGANTTDALTVARFRYTTQKNEVAA